MPDMTLALTSTDDLIQELINRTSVHGTSAALLLDIYKPDEDSAGHKENKVVMVGGEESINKALAMLIARLYVKGVLVDPDVLLKLVATVIHMHLVDETDNESPNTDEIK